MRKLGILAVLLVVLTGCSAQTAAAPEPVESTPENLNLGACLRFAALTMQIPQLLNDDSRPADEMWEGLRSEFDTIALTADGAVQDRMLDLVDDWPVLFDVAILHDFDDINGKIQAVERACQAEGSTSTFGTLTT